MLRVMGGITDIVRLVKKVKTKNVIICLWYDEYTIPSSIQSINDIQCKHLFVRDQKCNNCGAWVGHIGDEYELQDTYEHILWLVNSLYPHVDRILFKSLFPIPTEYKQRLTKTPYLYPKITTHSIYNRVVPISGMQHNSLMGTQFLTIFQKKHCNELIKTASLFCPNMSVYDLLLDDCIVVNPDNAEINQSYTKNLLVSNTKIIEKLS